MRHYKQLALNWSLSSSSRPHSPWEVLRAYPMCRA